MRHGSLESGLGGIDYAAEKIGWTNVFHCEINAFCRTILKYYWPNADTYTNIFTMDGRPYRGLIDIITCGFPCQPFSVAGKGAGDQDDRFIWPENMRIIREIQPPFVMAENVPGLLSKHPLVFERVCADLEAEGYEVTPLCIPACAKEKDHIRERLFFVAYNPDYRRSEESWWYGNGRGRGLLSQRITARSESLRGDTRSANSDGVGKEQSKQEVTGIRAEYSDGIEHLGDNQRPRLEGVALRQTRGLFAPAPNKGESWPEVAALLCRMDDGTADRLDPAAISKAAWYRESIRGYGNAVVWEVAYEIFRAIQYAIQPER